MFDNLVVDHDSNLVLLEDVGGSAHLGKVWKADLATGDLVQLASHNPALFDPNFAGAGVAGPGFLTQSEESSGVIDLSDILGDGWYAISVMAHFKISSQPGGNRFNFPNPDELVAGGQILLINTNAPTAVLKNGELTVTGTVAGDAIFLHTSGTNVTVSVNGRGLGSFSYAGVKSIVIDAGAGGDNVSLAKEIDRPTLILGGLGDDRLYGSGGRNLIVGGGGKDDLFGRAKDDVLVGNRTTLTTAQLRSALATWNGTGTYAARVGSIRRTLAGTQFDDGKVDRLTGAVGQDWFTKLGADQLVDRVGSELVN
jgi:Ca2+-binding RTX toxin-like protein